MERKQGKRGKFERFGIYGRPARRFLAIMRVC